VTYGDTFASCSNRIASISGPSPLSFTHDAAGSVSAMGNRTLSWDTDRRLRQVTEDIVPIATYAYKAFGQRVGKTVGARALSRCQLVQDWRTHRNAWNGLEALAHTPW
jgi:hypothetical protein